MKIVSRLIVALTLTVLTSSVYAQSVNVSPIVANPGDVVEIPVVFTEDAAPANAVDSLSFLLTFSPNTNITVNMPADCGTAAEVGATLKSCSVGPSSDAVFIQVGAATPLSSGSLGTITATVDAGANPGDILTIVASNITVSPAESISIPDSSLTVAAGPQPVWGSNPAPADGVSMSGQVSNIIAADVIVNNDDGDTGSTLTYSCAETADADNVFSLAGDITNHPVAVGSTGTVSIGCDSSTVGTYAGTMECTHDGAGSPETFALSCTVNAGPEPAYTAVTDLVLEAAQEGDADPTGSVTITNTGDTGTTLTGTCSLTGPDAQITMAGGAFSVAEGAAGAVIAVSCDASAEGEYSNTVSCAHNGTNVATPQTYPVTCSVGPAGAAIFSSTPANGDTIEMTPEDVPVDTVVPDQTLVISNAATDPADNSLNLFNCSYTGDAEITVGAAPASPIAPNGSSSTTFSCDTSAVGDYTGTYSCEYTVDGSGAPEGLPIGSVASYPVHCGVRAPGSELDTVPAPGLLTFHVPLNGTAYQTIAVSEALGEGEDATIDSCTLDDGSNFEIITTFPLTVPSGDTVLIEVSGTDPMDGSFSATDVMTCISTDTENGTVTSVWDLSLTVQTAAIPTLSTWGLLAMFLTMLGFGGIMIRRKESS